MILLIISRLHDILLLSFAVKMNLDVLKIGIEYKNFKRILGEILSKILGDFTRIWEFFIFLRDFRSDHPV